MSLIVLVFKTVSERDGKNSSPMFGLWRVMA